MSTETGWSYDQIAAVYATDMGQSMPFDDVGFYRNLAQRAAGPVLELGCGTGRILLPLLNAGIDVVGIDRSLPMLQQLCREAGQTSARVAQMDLRALALRGRFRMILAPYSLITYLTHASEVDTFLARLRELLDNEGTVLLDAFIPREVTPFEDFRRDYMRPHGSGNLERCKRIRRLSDGCNRIERRYRLLGVNGKQQQEFITVEVIRPYSAHELRVLLQRHGFGVRSEHFDYGASKESSEARFYSVLAS